MIRHTLQRSMRVLAVVAALSMAAVPAGADRINDLLTESEVAISWMNATGKALGQMLEEARRDRDAKLINCIEDRLVEIQTAASESEDLLLKVSDAAAAADEAEVEKTAARIAENRKLVEQLMKLVDNCQAKITKPGGFTEVTEESAELDEQGDPTKEEDEDKDPLPLPPDFSPPKPSPS